MAATVLEKYTYDVNVQKGGFDEQSVKVVAWNTSGTQEFSVLTDVNGDIAQQTVEAASHSVAAFVTTTTGRNPFRIRAVKYNNRAFQIGKSITEQSVDTFFTATNPDITQTTKATVDAYTGITISHAGDSVTLDGTGVTPVNDVDRLYDRLQSDGFDNPQYEYIVASDVFEVMSTGDKQNYAFNYDLIVSGFSFDGQNRSFNFGTGRDLTVQGSGGIVNDISIIGDYLLNTEANLSNVTITGDLRINTGLNSTLSFTNVSVSGNVWNDAASNTLTINATGSSLTAGDPGTGNGQTNIVASVPVSVTATFGGSPYEGAAVYLKTTGGVEVLNGLTNASGVLSGTYAGATPATIDSDVSGVKASSDSVPLEYFALSGTIESGTGYSASALLTED